jgi:hypothetical protein
VISPRPNERLRMISARRAREADLDKVEISTLGGAIYRRTTATSRADLTPSTAWTYSLSPLLRGRGLG